MSGDNLKSMVQDTFGVESDTEQDKTDIGEAFSDLIKTLNDEDQTKLFSDLNNEEINHLTVMEELGDDLLRGIADTYKKLKVSRARRGRKEVVDVGKALGALREQEDDRSALDRLKGAIV